MNDDLKKEVNALFLKLREQGISIVSLLEYDQGLLHLTNSIEASNIEAFNMVRMLMESNGDVDLFLERLTDNMEFDTKRAEVFLMTNAHVVSTHH